ncbi:hypothetical protein NT01EI_2152 [Edwardsiella ictaluri 93-146]|uniref:Uncharacterized protein n=1 Tax=Edwardsiella ictaluri (strain 93-146) TaxID=634503 RepID=C5BE87_EDWI9|nr:hypothetical protein NT01EI_2152 [Edwardsiella ictaluri 93-146]
MEIERLSCNIMNLFDLIAPTFSLKHFVSFVGLSFFFRSANKVMPYY